MAEYHFTREQARRFLLLKHGLLGDRRFTGKAGALAFVGQAGCVQYDPIDVCGKNAELVFASRVSGFRKEHLNELLYADRLLYDYFDKNMSIICVSDWKYFARTRESFRRHGFSREKIDAVAEEIAAYIRENRFACSNDLGYYTTVDWAWAPTRLSRAALETMYFRGDLIVHHKKGTIKYYALAEDFLDRALLNAEDPNKTEAEYQKWQVLRRIGSVGMLWNKPSDAWLGINGLKSAERGEIFSELTDEGKLIPCVVEGVGRLYFRAEDEKLAKEVLENREYQKRLEFLAPLDNLLWDRKLISAVFGFDYKWEIYTPLEKRKYGYYVMPVLYGASFAGRIETAIDKQKNILRVKNLWLEGGKPDAEFEKRLNDRLEQFAEFNSCNFTKKAVGKTAARL